jgi:hypothetical protein
MREENHPETARRATTLDSGPTLARGQSVRFKSVDDPYMGVAVLLQTLGCAHLLQEFKSKGCHDTLAVDLRADELVKSFGFASVTAQVCLCGTMTTTTNASTTSFLFLTAVNVGFRCAL